MADDRTPDTDMTEVARRLAVLRPHLNDAVSLTRVAADVGVSVRTARRWLARYRADGPAGLGRPPRPGVGTRKFAKELVDLIEGMALLEPPLSVATIHRRARAIAVEKEWRPASYGTVRDIVRQLGPALLTLAHEGAVAFRNRFELVHRHRAECPDATWQADHTELDILILDANSKVARPWLTTVIDDHSRAVAGYMVFLGAPSALNTSLALHGAKPIRRGQSAASPTFYTSITDRISPASILNRPPSIFAFN